MKMRILVVEDEPVLANAIVLALKFEFGDGVDLARDGQTALELSSHELYDVVVLDRSIPPPTGLQLVKLWRESQLSCPVLILSAWDSIGDRREAIESGADDYLSKPFSIFELRDRVRRLAQPLASAVG